MMMMRIGRIVVDRRFVTTSAKKTSEIYGIGTDIARVSRFEGLLRNRERRFIQRALHSREIDEYEKIDSEEKRILFVASRWAIKESVYKAMQMDKLQFPEIRIQKRENGKPDLIFEGEAEKFANGKNIREKFVSISHDGDYVVAFVTLTHEQ